jgi:gliding motility-associated-like protein
VATSPGGIVWVTGSFTKIVAIDGHYIDVPVASVDPVFIAGFEPHYGFYQGADALQSGGSRQAGIASSSGAVYLCSDYKYPCWPFIVGENVLPPAYQDQSWLYLAKYVLRSAGGPVLGEGEHTSRRDTTVCLEGGIDIALKARQGYLLYTWNDGTTDSVLSVTAPGTYWVKAMSPTDVARTDTIHVKTFEALCNCDAFMPTAFSPNADGRNDTYGPVMQSGCLISKYAFAIYNRWGEQVFYTENPYERWNGMYKNVPAELGVYMFYLRYAVNPSYPEYTKKGDMTVVR